MYSTPFTFGLVEKLKINYRCIVQVTSWIIRNGSKQEIWDLSIVILVTFTKNITEDERKREWRKFRDCTRIDFKFSLKVNANMWINLDETFL